jgi:dipeptidyl aminopeptidase/acylaminoacyl peptidase
VIKKLAEKYSYIDADRVGIYGHSAGGYDATRALLLFPDFYKVGVSSAGDHDQRMEKVWWPELYQGFPVDTQYHNQSNVTNASKLKGHLMLVTGDQDNNVNPSATFKLAGELTKANKDFELIVLPNDNHGTCYWNKYFIRKRWDFFVKNLLGVEHPKEYKIK